MPGPFDRSSMSFYLGGNPSPDGMADFPFNGIVETARVSKLGAYTTDFDPEDHLGADAKTLLLFQFDRETEQTVVDASGHGNDGIISGAELTLTIDAPLKVRSPVADGKIGEGEYGPPLKVDFTTRRNPGRLLTLNPNRPNWSETVPPQDLSYELFAAHTTRSLFLAFRVADDFIDDQIEDGGRVFWNDSIELFIDGDRVPNDFNVRPRRLAGREGFQIASDVPGRQLTVSNEFTNSDWRVATSRFPEGYVMEFEIPLALIDTTDGPGYTPATTGSFLWFNAVVNDNDSAVHGLEDYALSLVCCAARGRWPRSGFRRRENLVRRPLALGPTGTMKHSRGIRNGRPRNSAPLRPDLAVLWTGQARPDACRGGR